MSAAQPTEQLTPAASPASSQSTKPQRILSCVLCQQRKVKCNRKTPCDNCIKVGVPCLPATATRRRRRRFPERELLDRLRKYEDLLRKNGISFEPLHGDGSGESGSRHVEGSNESDEEVAQVERPRPATYTQCGRVYETKNFWQAMNQGLKDNMCHSDAPEAMVKSIWSENYGKNDHLLLGTRKTPVDLSTLHPEPVQIFRLWQIYLDNVNPLLKVTYTPSLQGRIIEAASNVSGINTDLEALMFSIYCVSIQSLTADDCQTIFNSPKNDLVRAYQFGCEQALLNCGFLQSNDRDCLTALFLYLVSLGPSTDPRYLCSMFGVAIRIAQRLRMHSEASNAKCSPLEAEMRRRLWWSLVLLDTRIGELADYKPTMLSPTWDCKIPLHVNDSDLWPEMKEPPAEVQGKPTDALFTVVRSELGEFVRHSGFYLDFTTPALKPDAKGKTSGLDALEKMLGDRYLQFCNPENPLHLMTICMAQATLAKCRLIEQYSRYSHSPTQPTQAQLDAALSYAFTMLDCDTKVMTSPLTKGYIWCFNFYFPLPAYIHIVQDLKRRPVGRHAEQAWEVMSANHDIRFARSPMENPFFDVFAKIILQAWEVREAHARKSGEAPIPPRMVLNIRERMLQNASETRPAETEHPSNTMDMNLLMDGFPMSMPMGFGGSSLLFGMGEQDHTGTGVDVFSDINVPETALEGNTGQFNWPAIWPGDWGLGSRRP